MRNRTGVGSVGGGLAMGMALAALYLSVLGLNVAPCWGLFFLVALVAWPIWQYQQEVALFERRAILARIASESGRLRRWLWRGSATRVLQVFVALFWALLLLTLSMLLEPLHWLVLVTDVLLLAVAVGPLQRRLAAHIKPGQLGVVTRRWPLMLGNLLVLTAAFLALDFLVVGAPDTRGMLWHQLAERSFAQASGRVTCPAAGALVGALAAVQALTWHTLEVAIPQLPRTELRLAAWAVFLVQAGSLAYAFTRLMLGSVSLVERRRGLVDAVVGKDTFSRAFILTILVLAIPYLYATLRLSAWEPSALEQPARDLVAWVDPCGTAVQDAAASLSVDLNDELATATQAAKDTTTLRIEQELDALFAGLEPGVERYLDWYFTVIGGYQRLAAVVTGDFAESMTQALERYLFEDTGFAEGLERAHAQIADTALAEMTELGGALGLTVRERMLQNTCALGALDLSELGNLDRDRMRVSAAAGTGAVAGVVTVKALSKQTATAVAAKLATKKGFQAAAAVAGKAAAKKGGSVLLSAAGAAAVCSPGGPLAAVCGILAGTVTWLAVDKALVEVDEALFREQMRSEMLEVLALEQAHIERALTAHHRSAIEAMSMQIQDAIDRIFVPVRDGL